MSVTVQQHLLALEAHNLHPQPDERDHAVRPREMCREKPTDDQQIGGVDRVSHNAVEPASLQPAMRWLHAEAAAQREDRGRGEQTATGNDRQAEPPCRFSGHMHSQRQQCAGPPQRRISRPRCDLTAGRCASNTIAPIMLHGKEQRYQAARDRGEQVSLHQNYQHKQQQQVGGR